MKKILKIAGISIGSIILVAVLGLGIIFSGEIRTLLTFKQLNDQPFYEMTYHADYGLDEFLEQGAATDDELVSFVTKKILKGVSFEVNPDGACSTFIATTPEGDDLFGRNFDYVPSIGLIVRTAPKNGYESISVVNLNHLGLSQENMPTKNLLNRIITLAAPYAPLDGMNEKGLSIGVLVINKGIVHQSTGKVPITTTSAIRMILDKAATVDEAITLLEQYDMNSSGDTGYHFQIADAEGNTAIVEYIDNEMHVLTKEE
ncbi:MAG: linear amide C-N hydrolase, partial [Candidatus Niameybacter stercoravium]|nr:linear amide C-N hydrolase [Candidatus Niameybacter stercoravium]